MTAIFLILTRQRAPWHTRKKEQWRTARWSH